MKTSIFAILALVAATSAFADSESFPTPVGSIGTSTPGVDTGSEGTVSNPQQLNYAPLNCAVNGTDGSGQVLLVCQNGGNG